MPQNNAEMPPEKMLDEALQDSFPASDPLAFTPRRAGKGDHHTEPTTTSPQQRWKVWMNRIFRPTTH